MRAPAVIPLALLCLASVACSQPGSSPLGQSASARDCSSPSSETSTRLVTFGDSQTMGLTSAVAGCRFSWAYSLAQTLSLPLVNYAIGGSSATSSSSLGPAQLSQIMSADLNPSDTVIWSAGFNDARAIGASSSSSKETFRQAVREGLARLSEHSGRVIITTPFLLLSYENGGSDSLMREYASIIIEVASELKSPNVSVLDVQSLFSPQLEELQGDTVHLSPQGQIRLASIIGGAL